MYAADVVCVLEAENDLDAKELGNNYLEKIGGWGMQEDLDFSAGKTTEKTNVVPTSTTPEQKETYLKKENADGAV